MKCSHCGREVAEGQIYCDCGYPVSIDSSGTSSTSSTASAQTNNFYASAVPRSTKGKGQNTVVSVIVVVFVIILGILYSTYKSTWAYTSDMFTHEVTGDGYAVTLPTKLSKTTDEYEEEGFNNVAFYNSQKAIFDIATADSNVYDITGFTVEDFAALDSSYKLRDDYAYTTYTDSTSGDTLYIVEAVYIKDNVMWCIQAGCLNKEKSKFEDSLFKWLDSFETK